MAAWQCPTCGTPQPETARCWVCASSSTTCSTCLHFRRTVAGGPGATLQGTCGLDPHGRPLRGTEIRPCWEGREGLPFPADGLFAVAKA